MPSATARNRVLSILMNARDRMTPAFRIATRALRTMGRIARGVFRAIAFGARIAARAVRSVAASLGPVVALLAPLLALLSGAVLVRFFHNVAKAGDELAKTSKRIGVAVEDLSVLSHASQISGADFAQVAKGYQRMARNIYDATQGLQTNVDTLSQLGLQIYDTSGELREPMEIFMDAADLFAAMPDGVKKTALALRLFGRAGADLLPLMNEGREGIAGLAEDAERLNLVWTSWDAAKAEAYIDAWTRFKASLSGMMRIVFINLGPPVSRMLESFATSVANAARSLGSVMTALTDGLRESSEYRQEILDTLDALGSVAITYAQWLASQAMAIFAGTLIAAATRVAPVIGRKVGGMIALELTEQIGKTWSDIWQGIGDFAQKKILTAEKYGEVDQIAVQLEKFSSRMIYAGEAMEFFSGEAQPQLVDAMDEISRAMREALGDVQEYMANWGDETSGAAEDVRKAWSHLSALGEKIRAELDRLLQPPDEGANEKGKAGRWGQWWAGFVGAAKDAWDEVGNFGAAGTRAWTTFANALQTQFDTAFNSIITGTESVSEAFKAMGREILIVIGKILAQQLAASIVSSIFGKGATATATAAAIPAAERGAVFAGGTTSVIPITRYARGGVTPAGGVASSPHLAIFGEGRKREAMVPLPDNRHIPAIVTEPAGGPSVHQEIHIHAIDSRSVQEMLVNEGDIIRGIVSDGIARRHNFRQTIRRA